MSPNVRPWTATVTARVMRLYDTQTFEVIDYANGQFARRYAGPGGPGGARSEVLDESARQALLDELRAELLDLPHDVSRPDMTTFTTLLEGSFALTAA